MVWKLKYVVSMTVIFDGSSTSKIMTPPLGRLVGGSAQGISIYNDEGWRNILEIKTINTDTIHSNYDYSHFIADTIPHDFGGFIADLEQGPDGLLYCAIRGSYVASTAPNRTSGGVIILVID